MTDKPHPFWSVIQQWTAPETESLFAALKRDRSLRPKELAEYVRTKNEAQIQKLIHVLLSISERDLIGSNSPLMLKRRKMESSLDVLLQITKHISPNEFAFSKVIGDVLTQFASTRSTRTHKPSLSGTPHLNYAELYSFMASLFSNKHPTSLGPLEASAMMDLLTCIIQVMKLFIPHSTGNSSHTNEEAPTTEATSSSQEPFLAAKDKVIQLTGTYLASAAAVQLGRFQSPPSVPYSSDVLRSMPVAPFFVLNEVERPKHLKISRHLKNILFRNLSKQWKLPELPESLKSAPIQCDLRNPSFRHLIKVMNQFTLNPFGFPLSWMKRFQELIDQTCGPFGHVFGLPSNFDSGSIMSCMQLLRTDGRPQPSKRPTGKRPSSFVDKQPSKRRKLNERPQLTPIPPQSEQGDEQLASKQSTKVRKSGDGRVRNRSKFYKPLEDEDALVTKTLVDQYVRVQNCVLSEPRKLRNPKKT